MSSSGCLDDSAGQAKVATLLKGLEEHLQIFGRMLRNMLDDFNILDEFPASREVIQPTRRTELGDLLFTIRALASAGKLEMHEIEDAAHESSPYSHH